MGTAWLAKEAADGPHGVSGVTLASRDGPPLRKEAMPLMTRRAVRSRLFLLAVVIPLLAVTLTACFGSSRSSVTPKPGPTPVPTGRLIVNSDPQNAEIFLDGKPTGLRTPAELNNLAPGTYELTLVKDGIRLTTPAMVQRGEPTPVMIPLNSDKVTGRVVFGRSGPP